MKRTNNIYPIVCCLFFFMVSCKADDIRQPLACFEVGEIEIIENQSVDFINCSENAIAYYWTFGDGSTSIHYHTSHQYQQPGIYEVQLMVFSGEQNDIKTMQLTVNEDPLPIACFTVPSSNTRVGESFTFTNCSEKADSYLWDFGDGNTSTEKNPTHTYQASGNMLVVLTAINQSGQRTTSRQLSVAGREVLFYDGFEDYEDFSLSFGNWTQVDNDGSTTYGLALYSFRNSNYIGSYIIFNPYETEPPAVADERFLPFNGRKYAACFAARQRRNDDWLISPQISLGQGYELSFAAKAFSHAYGPDLFVVQLEKENGDMVWLSPQNQPINPPTDWTVYNYDLNHFSGTKVKIHIGCLTDNGAAMFFDDITVRTPTGDGDKGTHRFPETTRTGSCDTGFMGPERE